MNRVSVKGVAIGAIVDVVASSIVAIPLIVYVMMQTGVAGAPAAGEIMQRLHDDPSLYATHMALGLACSMLGGFVAGRIAKHDEVLNGALSSFLCVLFGLYSVASGYTFGSGALETALTGVASVAASTLGGFLARKPKQVGTA